MKIYIPALFLIILINSCARAPKNVAVCDIKNDTENYLTITPNNDPPERAFNVFCKKVEVFGVILYATPGVPNEKLLHAANVMAQYLDNNEDSIPDNPAVVEKLVQNKAAMLIFEKDGDKDMKRFQNSIESDSQYFQDLYAEETRPGFDPNGSFGEFDFALEEVYHLICFAGYSEVYPEIFGFDKGSSLCNAMDVARGGQFNDVPASYPAEAWYHYDDKTCDYGCMAIEYMYWAQVTIYNAHIGHCDEIANEWEICNVDQLMTTDSVIYNLLTDSAYHLPLVMPNGKYMQ